jgi:hypothetical protein
MANRVIEPSKRRWEGLIKLGNVMANSQFEVFDSCGGWGFLFSKLLLRLFKATHNYEADTVTIRDPRTKVTTILHNQLHSPITEVADKQGISLMLDVKQWENIIGGSSAMKPPSRQVPTSIRNTPKPGDDETEADEHTDPDSELNKATNMSPTVMVESTPSGLQADEEERKKLSVQGGEEEPPAREVTINLKTDCQSLSANEKPIAPPDNPASIHGVTTVDNNVYTRHTEPFKAKRVKRIISEITVGPDIMLEQHSQVEELIGEFADCFALAMTEVNIVPGAVHKLNIPSDAKFRTKLMQRSLNPAQKMYLHMKVDDMITAGIIAPIHPQDVRAVAPVVLSKKTHEGQGLPLDELKHRVNDRCVELGLPSAEELPPQPVIQEKNGTDEPQGQNWWLCQDFSEVNRVTQIAPMAQGNIRGKQQRLSGHQYVHVFDFAAGFYAISIETKSQPYLTFFVEGKGYFKYLRLPFGVTGGLSEFGQLTAERLCDLVGNNTIELFVDNGGSAANTFEEGMSKLRQLLNRVRKEKLSLSASKLRIFMMEAVFAGATVGTNGVKPDTAKLTAIVEWPTPQDASHLEGFLGLSGYFRDLIKGYAKLEKPL